MKEGIWFRSVEATLRKKILEAWTDKHRYVLRKIHVEGGWVQKSCMILAGQLEEAAKYMKIKGTCAGPKWLTKGSKLKFRRWGKLHLGGHDIVRRVDRHGEVLMWCRQCSGHARQRMGPKLMNCCKPAKMGRKKMETC